MEKIKQFLTSEQGKDVLVILIVILVGLASFGLGRLSKNSESSGIKIEYPEKLLSQEASVLSSLNNNKETKTISSKTQPPTSTPTQNLNKTFFASSRGSKYYYMGCSGGKTIKKENLVYFNTSTEAEQAGYELSATCK